MLEEGSLTVHQFVLPESHFRSEWNIIAGGRKLVVVLRLFPGQETDSQPCAWGWNLQSQRRTVLGVEQTGLGTRLVYPGVCFWWAHGSFLCADSPEAPKMGS